MRDLLERSIDAWCGVFDPKDRDYLPIIKVDVVLDENASAGSRIGFEPTMAEFIDVLRYVVEKVAHSINGPSRIRISTIQAFLNGDETIALDTHLTQSVVDRAGKRLADLTEHYFEAPKQLIQAYEEKYSYLIDGTAQKDVERFNSENHIFDEYTQVSADRRLLISLLSRA